MMPPGIYFDHACAWKTVYVGTKAIANVNCKPCDGQNFSCPMYTFVFSELGKSLIKKYVPQRLVPVTK